MNNYVYDKNDINLVELASSNFQYIEMLKYLLKNKCFWNETIYNRIKKYGYTKNFMNELFDKKFKI